MLLRDYGRVITRRWWLFLLFALIGAGSAYGFSKLQTPLYRSTAKLYIQPSRMDYGQTLVIQNLIRSYSQQISSERFLGQVSSNLKLDLNPGALRGKVNVTGTADNFMIQIDVDDPNPAIAQRISIALAQAFVDENQRRMLPLAPSDRIDVGISDSPLPGTLTQPKTAVNTIAGFALGLLLGVLLAFVLEYLDDTIKEVDGVDRFIALPTLGTIPRFVQRDSDGASKSPRAGLLGLPVALLTLPFASGGRMPATPSTPARLINHRNPRSPVAEAYRQLRTNIQFSSLDKKIQTLLLTSTGPQEGKSTTLANLAIAIAGTGSKVIVVDCDLRRPTQHKLFNLTNGNGLTNLMVEHDLSNLNCQPTDVPNLSVITTGPIPPNPSELLGSHRMEEIIARLRSEADYVLFDTPPVVAVTDAAVLATKVDGVVLVIQANRTKRDVAQRAKAQLEKVGANLIGVVLNSVKYDTSIHNYFADQ